MAEGPEVGALARRAEVVGRMTDPLGYDLFDLAVIIAGSAITAALIAVIVGGALLGWWS